MMKRKEWMKDIFIFLSTIFNTIAYYFSGFSKRKENYVVFGAWGGEKYSDNPKFLIESFRADLSLELFWVGKEHLKDLAIFEYRNVHFLKRNSIQAYRILLQAKLVYFSNSYRDLGYLNFLKGAIVTQLWHGFGLKNTLSTKRHISKIKKLYYTMGEKRYEKYDYFISSSPYNTKKILETFQYNGITKENILKSGQPKNDILIQEAGTIQRPEYKSRFHKRYGIDPNMKVITYLPTFRDHNSTFQFSRLEGDHKITLQKLLQRENAVLLEKMHIADALPYVQDEKEDHLLRRLDPQEDATELLLATDLLISDYSSCYLDFTLLDRPIIHFVYDLENYQSKDRGLYYSLEEFHAGPIVKDFETLLRELEKNLNNDPYQQKRNKVRKTLMEYEAGKSCEIIKQHIHLVR